MKNQNTAGSPFKALLSLALISFFLFFYHSTYAAAKTWTGNTSTAWATATNWNGNTLPTSKDDITIPVKPNMPVLSTGFYTVRSITVQKGASFTQSGAILSVIGASVQISGTFNQTGGWMFADHDFKILTGGIFNQSGFSFLDLAKDLFTTPAANFNIAGTATVNQSGGNIYVRDYNNSPGTFNQTGSLALLKIYRDWKPGSGSNFKSTSGTVEFAGNGSTGADFVAGTRQFNNVIVDAGVNPGFNNNNYNNNFFFFGSTLYISGNFTNYNTAMNNSSSVTFIFNGTSVQTIYSAVTGTSNATFGNLFITNNGGTVLLTSNANVSGSILLLSGTFDLSTYTCNKVSGNGILWVAGKTTMRLSGSTGGQTGSNFPLRQFAFLNSTSTVEYYGNPQTIYSTPTYGNLVVSATGTKTAGGALTILGSFTLTTATFVAGNYGHKVGVNWTMSSGIFTNTGSTVTFNGKGTQNIASTGAFNNITINKPSGTTNITTDVTTTTLAFIKGIINTSANKVIIPSGGNVTGAGPATGWVNGNMQKYFSTTAGGTFEIGGAQVYTPISSTSFNAFTAGSLIAGVTSSAHPNISSSTMATKNISRFWKLSLPASGQIAFNKSTVSFNWNTSDNYSPMNTALLQVAKYSGATWSYPAISGTPTATTITTSNVSNLLGDFAIGEILPLCTVSSGFRYSASEFCTDGGAAAVTLNSGATSGIFTSTPLGLSINSATGTITPASSTPGTYTITNTAVAGACISTSSQVIQITAAPSATITYPGSSYCQTGGYADVTLTGTTGGTFSSTYGLTIDDQTGQVDLANSTPGTYTVTYTVNAASPCLAVSTNTTITVTKANFANIAYRADSYCLNGGTASVDFEGTTGGAFSSSSGLSINATTGDITLASCTPGTYAVAYSGAASNSCAAFADTTTVIITSGFAGSISYSGSPYCPAGTATVTITGQTDGRFYSTPGLAIDDMTGDIDLSSSTPGTYTVTYSLGGCNATTNVTIAATAAISYAGSPYCLSSGTATVTLTGTGGGSYSSTAGLSLNASGNVNINTSTPGTYTVTYTVPATGTCPVYPVTGNITIGAIGTWSGAINTAWNLSGNWKCGFVPINTTNVTIPSGLTNYPDINLITPEINDLKLDPGSLITINNGTLKIRGNITANNGYITSTNGTVEFTGASSQTIPDSLFTSGTIKDLVITNPSGVSLTGPLRVTGSVGFGNVNNSVFNTGDSLTLASVLASDACIRDVTNTGINSGNTINGFIIVERYMPPKRAYRFITAPVNSTGSIKANWMENSINPDRYNRIDSFPGYGTNITGAGDAANGFDPTQTHNPSMFTFNNQTQTWSPIPNTNGLMAVGNAYRIIVRGDRTIDMNTNTPTPTPTTLRAKGNVMIGDVNLVKAGAAGGMPYLSANTWAYNLVANPYPSPVNWLTVDKTDLSGSLYFFDPTITGSNGRGAYVSYNCTMGANSNSSSFADNYIQSGQSFFVQTTGPNPSIRFKETDKSGLHRSVFRTYINNPCLSVQLLLPSQEGTPDAADGFKVFFSDDFSNAIGQEDSYKFTNQDENLGIMRNGNVLSIEGRKPIVQSDTIPLKMWQLTQKNYILKVNFEKFAYNVEAYLEDKYLHLTSPLSTYGETKIPVNITSDAASFASDRFKIIFQAYATLPLHLLGIKAVEKNNGVEVGWTAESESNMDRYEVEKSTDGQQFVTAGTVKAKTNPGPSSFYSWFDLIPFEGDNYYRIKSVDKSGDIKYSSITKVRITKGMTAITVFPNPVHGKIITLAFSNIKKGNYSVRLMNSLGEKVYDDTILHNGGSSNHSIELSKVLPTGVYQLLISNSVDIEKISVLVQ